MAIFRVATPTRNAMLDSLRDKLDAGSAGGTIQFYTGTQPADADTALAGNTLLGTLTCAATSAPNAAAGTLTFNAITEDSAADATGTATWARVADSDGNAIFDCDVGTSGATINMTSTAITAGGPIRISETSPGSGVAQFTISIPAA